MYRGRWSPFQQPFGSATCHCHLRVIVSQRIHVRHFVIDTAVVAKFGALGAVWHLTVTGTAHAPTRDDQRPEDGFAAEHAQVIRPPAPPAADEAADVATTADDATAVVSESAAKQSSRLRELWNAAPDAPSKPVSKHFEHEPRPPAEGAGRQRGPLLSIVDGTADRWVLVSDSADSVSGQSDLPGSTADEATK